MASNKFATMLNRKTNRITLVLVYAVLEWTLILFLLLNSLFSYLIIKFANYFGLKPPCLLCSRIDHIFEPQNSNSSYRDLICEHHGIELSRSGYCFNHRKLVESQDMCEDCWSEEHQGNRQHPTVVLAFRWLSKLGMVKSDGDCKVVGNYEVNLRCCCCGMDIKSEILSPPVSNKPSLLNFYDKPRDVDFDGVLDDTHKVNRVELLHDVDFDGELDQNGADSSGLESNGKDEVERSRDIQLGEDDNSEGLSFSLSKEGYSLVEANEDDEEVVLENGADLSGLESNGKNEVERSRDIQLREDDNSEGVSFSLSKEGYSLVEANEDDEEVVLEAETEPLLESSVASMGYIYADEKILPQHLEFYIDLDDYQLIPVELMSKGESRDDLEEDKKSKDQEKVNELWRETDDEFYLEPGMTVVPAVVDNLEKLNSASLDWLEFDENKIEDLPTIQEQEQEIVREIDVGVRLDEAVVKDFQTEKGQKVDEVEKEVDAAVVLDEGKVDILPVIEGQTEMATKEIDFDVAGDQECDVLVMASVDQVTEEREVTEPNGYIPISELGGMCHEENDAIDIVSNVESLKPCKDECPSIHDITGEASISSNGYLEKEDHVESMQIEERLNHEITELELLHKEIPFLRKMESSDAKTLDGSFVNNEVATVDKLKSLLESERKALNALYTELEEERNAAAIAANHTMAMINRLQEEKATIEMEALQYQRLMEEQSEYDQEALQLMNEMLVKRERDLQDLEKELEIYRKKVTNYEERERIRLSKSRMSSACCSNGEESDELSVDLNNESRDEDGFCKIEENGHQNTPVDAILDLQDSLSNFEEERLSILEQLKVLEEKLCTLSEEEELHIDNMKPFEQFYEENAKEFNKNSKLNGKHNNQEKWINGSKPKQLLSLFDEAEIESDSELSNGVEDEMDNLGMHKPLPTKFELEKKRLAIEMEMDHVYERVHALEADREFVKHCVGSLRKGDKGLHLLQEILQHLRDLKNIELQAKNVCVN